MWEYDQRERQWSMKHGIISFIAITKWYIEVIVMEEEVMFQCDMKVWKKG